MLHGWRSFPMQWQRAWLVGGLRKRVLVFKLQNDWNSLRIAPEDEIELIEIFGHCFGWSFSSHQSGMMSSPQVFELSGVGKQQNTYSGETWLGMYEVVWRCWLEVLRVLELMPDWRWCTSRKEREREEFKWESHG
jgi:hypothetical protein